MPRSWKLFAFSLLVLLTGAAATVLATPTEAAVAWWVDQTNSGCSDTGPGTELVPFCSIKPGATKALAGDTVVVRPGLYREQVTPKFSGTPGVPITYRADGAGVLIQGTLNLSDAAGWSPTATTAWSRPYAPSSAPKQVFLDGVRISVAPSATETTANSFFYDAVAFVLYVDIGGGNPADGHVVEAGAFTYGFLVTGKNDIVIDGFEMKWQNSNGVRIGSATAPASAITVQGTTISYTSSYGIQMDTGTGPIIIENNSVSYAGSVGIRLLNSTGVVARRNASHHNAFHGMALAGSNGNQIIGNTLYANFNGKSPTANGLDVNGASSDNFIKGNTAFQNEDSGIQVYNGSNRNLLVRNVSRSNGDHGFDTNQAADTTYISNTSYGNHKDGFSVEGNSINTTLVDNIAVDNGLTTSEFDLYVDPNSTTGLSDDYNIFWNSAPGTTIKVNLALYPTLADYAAATSQEAHGIGADPLFVEAGSGDLHLSAGSPAVDAADASAPDFSADDHDGRMPVDLTSVPDTGAGTPSYADRGAYEYDAPPAAALSVGPSSGPPPLFVTADASGSTDPDSTPIAFYTFDFGDGTVVGPQAEAAASHTYTAFGIYTVTVTVADTAGQSATATAQVSANDLAPAAALTVTPTSGLVNLTVAADATASTDNDTTPIATFMFDFGDGTVVGPQAAATASHTYTRGGLFTVTVTVTDTAGLSSTATRQVTVTDNPPVARLSVSPTSGLVNLTVAADASASTDGDSTPIATFTFDFGDGAVVGPQAAATASHSYTRGGLFTVTVTVTDTAGLSSTATRQVTVTDNPPVARLSVSPTSGRKPLAVTATASASTDTDGTPIATYTFNFADGAIVGPQASPTATHTYTKQGNYQVRVTVTDTAGLSGTAVKALKVQNK